MILLDYKDRRPIYEQIVDKLSDLMVRGILTENTPLPSVRSLAMDLSINPNTVQRAYLELERLGYIHSLKGKGSFVANPEQIRNFKQQSILEELRLLTDRAVSAGLEEDALCSIIHTFYHKERSHTIHKGGQADD